MANHTFSYEVIALNTSSSVTGTPNDPLVTKPLIRISVLYKGKYHTVGEFTFTQFENLAGRGSSEANTISQIADGLSAPQLVSQIRTNVQFVNWAKTFPKSRLTPYLSRMTATP